MSRKSMLSGFDPMGGNWFSEKDMRQQRDLEHFPIPLIGKCSRPARAPLNWSRSSAG
jgi:hypothetical protein